MGLFDFLGKKGASSLSKHVERVANRRAQAPDRWDSIQSLIAAGTEEAISGLLTRFTFYVDPSTTDQEEKDAAFNGIIKTGEVAIAPTRAFLRKAQSLSWGLKVFERLLSAEAVLVELLALLKEMDTEYERDPQRKIQLLSALEERQSAEIVPAVARFLEDVNETCRFHAVGTVLAQSNADEARDALLEALGKEESVRVRSRIVAGFSERKWSLGADATKARALLPDGFAIDPAGIPLRQ